jgi:hypothetical protein
VVLGGMNWECRHAEVDSSFELVAALEHTEIAEMVLGFD